MSDDTTHVSKKLDEMRRQATARLEEARALVASMNTVETIFDLPLTMLADLETSALTTPPPEGAPKGSAEPWGNAPQHKRRSVQSIRPDEFLGEEPMKAAKKYIAGVGHAIHFDEIADAVQRGNAAISGADWRERLELSLKRSPYDVITVAENTYGLAAFYTPEQLGRLKASRRGGDSSPTREKKKKHRGRPKGKPKQVAKRKEEPKQAAKSSANESPQRKKRRRPPKQHATVTAKSEPAASEHVH